MPDSMPQGVAVEGPAAWYLELTPPEKRTFWTCFLGWALDAMDVQIYGLALGAIATTFALTKAQSGLIGTLTLFTSAFGGWLAGLLSDRFGRVRTLQVTVAWFAFFTFLCGLAQNYQQFVVLRVLMGFGFGGEWAAGAVLIGEVIRAEHRGKAVGSVQSGWAVGSAVALIAWTLLSASVTPERAWRILFMLGILPALFVFFIRRFVDEPPVFTATQAETTGKGGSNFLEIFSPTMLRTTILCSILTTGAQGGYYAISTWLPSFLQDERKLSVVGSFPYLAVIIVGSFILRDRARLYATPRRRHADAVSGLPARLLRLGDFFRHGPVPDRKLSDADARLRSGLHL
jgi:MFS family permease